MATETTFIIGTVQRVLLSGFVTIETYREGHGRSAITRVGGAGTGLGLHSPPIGHNHKSLRPPTIQPTTSLRFLVRA